MLTDYIPGAYTGTEYAVEYQLMISTVKEPDPERSSLILMVDAAYPFAVFRKTPDDQAILQGVGEFVKNLPIPSLTELFPSIPDGAELWQLIGVRARISKIDCPAGDVVESAVVDYLKAANWDPVLASVDQENA